MSARRRGLSWFESDEVFAVDGLLMSVGLAHRNDADVVFSFCGDDRYERIAKRTQRHKSLLAVVEAAIFKCHRHAGFNDFLRVDKVEAMPLEIARLLCGRSCSAQQQYMYLYVYFKFCRAAVGRVRPLFAIAKGQTANSNANRRRIGAPIERVAPKLNRPLAQF